MSSVEVRVLRSMREVEPAAWDALALPDPSPFVEHTWLGAGDTLEKYAKRPLLLAATFLLAHASTFHFEARWIALGRRTVFPLARPQRR